MVVIYKDIKILNNFINFLNYIIIMINLNYSGIYFNSGIKNILEDFIYKLESYINIFFIFRNGIYLVVNVL